MNLLIQGTKAEIEGIQATAIGSCRLPCSCRDCAFSNADADCLLTYDILQFLRACADCVIRDDEEISTAVDTESQKKIADVVDGIKETLLTKNKRYGNAVFAPLRIFSKKESTETDIPARLDDKLSRIKNSPELRVNDIADLIGYSILLLVHMGVKKQDLLDLID